MRWFLWMYQCVIFWCITGRQWTRFHGLLDFASISLHEKGRSNRKHGDHDTSKIWQSFIKIQIYYDVEGLKWIFHDNDISFSWESDCECHKTTVEGLLPHINYCQLYMVQPLQGSPQIHGHSPCNKKDVSSKITSSCSLHVHSCWICVMYEPHVIAGTLHRVVVNPKLPPLCFIIRVRA